VSRDVIDRVLVKVGIRQDIINRNIDNNDALYKDVKYNNCEGEVIEICPVDAISNEKLCIHCMNCIYVCNENAVRDSKQR
jgi:polyferredoxin